MKKMVGVLCLLMTVSAAAVTYDDEYTARKGSAYHQDINVWVYTGEFAKRFGMPDRWIDEGLKGAYAVAFRVEKASGGMMLPHKGPSASIPIRRCILDLYLPSKAKLPWVDDREVGIRYKSPESPKYLIPQSQEDKEYKLKPVGFGEPLRSNISLMTESGYSRGLSVIAYDKSLYPGVAYVSLSMGCMTPAVETSYVEFLGPWKRNEQPVVLYRIAIPKSFKEELYMRWKDAMQRPSGREYGDILSK